MARTDDINYFGAHPHVTGPQGSRERTHVTIDDMEVELPETFTLDNLVRNAWVEIDLDAIKHNVMVARKHVGTNRKLMAVVKADAYGHGAVRVAQTALKAGADYLGVATVEEGVELREADIDAPILILAQPPMRAIPLLLKYEIMPAVTTSEFALALGEEADLHGVVAKYHLAIDTGMNRIGVSYRDVVDFMQSINFHRGLQCEGVFTHFATADMPDDWDFRIQLKRFNEAVQMLVNARIDPGIVHAANSASIERFPECYFDMVRLGITLYGAAPSPELRGVDPLKPAMSVKARISYIKEPQLGEGVSYGLHYRVAKPVQIATLPIGYADGINRALSGHMKVLCNGRPCQQVGTICMDQMMVEIPLGHSIGGAAGGAEIGDEVVIIGSQGKYTITIDMMADQLGTIPYELLCAFSRRLPRVYVQGAR